MLSACQEYEPSPVEAPAATVRPLRRVAVTAILEEGRKRAPRRKADQTAVPAYSRIVFRLGSAHVR